MKKRNKMLNKIRTILLSIICVLPLFLTVAVIPARAIEPGIGEYHFTGKRDFKWPVPDWYGLSGCFTDGRAHYAIDIAAGWESKVVAAYDGTVVDLGINGNHDSGFGNSVLVMHENYFTYDGNPITLYTHYSHLNSIDVKIGDPVVAGETRLGGVGASGYGYSQYPGYGVHLDFQILTDSDWRNWQSHSIDPYKNELLELPSGIVSASQDCCGKGTPPSECCCGLYIDEVKKIYAVPQCNHENYTGCGICSCGYVFDWESTFDSNTAGTYLIQSDFVPRTDMPYDDANKASTELKAGDSVTVLGSYQNAYSVKTGHSWYKFTYGNGETGYVYDTYLKKCDHSKYQGCGVCAGCGYIYDWESTFDSSIMGSYTVLEDCTPRTDMPYDDATKATVKLNAGDTVEVLGSYRNAYYRDTNHIWYKFKYNGGEIGYVYDEYLQFSGYAPMQVSCSNFSPADQAVLEKKAQPVSGLVESVYPLKAVHAHLDGSWIGTWRASNESTKTVELRQTEINTNLAFETLSDGKHTISLFAEDIFHADSVKFMETVFYINTKDDGCSHSYTSSVTKEPSCTESGVRTYICGNCSDRYTESIPETGHSWADATCTTPKTCSNCGSTEGAAADHNWTDATCSTPKTCTTCGTTEGNSLGHDWLDATCDSPKTCDRCGETDGAALGHQWEDSVDDQYCPICGQFENPSRHGICSNHALTAINRCPACTKDSSLHICENNFTDLAFRGYVVENFDSNSDGYLDEMELDRCWNVTLVDQDNVLSVQGIEFFSAMESLTTPGDGKIASIDVRWNSLLNTLVCGEERLTYLDVSHNHQLQTLQCSLNSLEELDVSHNPRLLNLTCEGNLLTMIDISNNPLLQSLNCSKNSLTTLDVSCNTKLRHLRCKETGLTALDVSNNPELVELWCSNNEIPSLDLSNAPNLIDLECRENTIAVLNLGNCTNLVLDSYSITPQIISTQISAIPVDEGFAVDMAEIVGPQHIDNIVDVEDADYDTSDGIAIFEEYPLNFSYRYDTGSNDARFGKMTAVVSLKECVHQWNIVSCTEPRQCSICKIHDDTIVGHDWTQQIQNEEHIKEATADCRSSNVYWYDCSRCDTISDTEYYTGTKTGDHVFTQKIEDDTHWKSGDCQNFNQYYYDCAYCDEIGSETFTATTKGNHSMSQEWSTSEEKHYHKCTISGCTYISDEGEHIPGDPATETNDQTCIVCDFVITPALVHVHKTSIVPGYVATCTTAGQKTYYTCTCGKWFSDTAASSEISNKADVVIPALGHDWLPATTTKPKTCQRTGCNATEGTVREPYQIISGANSSWKYLNGNLTIASDGAFSEFVGVKLDGKWVDNKYYTVKEGSTYVTLKKTYLRTLDDGTYRVTLVFDHDEVSTNLTIATNFDWTNPFTGDTSGIVMWCIILGGSFGLLTYITVHFIRKKKSRKNH